jgi:hypothetical protein
VSKREINNNTKGEGAEHINCILQFDWVVEIGLGVSGGRVLLYFGVPFVVDFINLL